MRATPGLDENNLRHLYLEEKLTDIQIGKLLGCHKQTVYNRRRQYGIEAFKRWQRNECNPTDRQLDIIYGTLLGDGHVSRNSRTGRAANESCLGISHGWKQKGYVEWKFNEVKELCHEGPKQVADGKWRFRTFQHPFFSKLRKDWYPNGVKIVPDSYLQHISELGVAVWYMDDGHLGKKSNFLKISTCSFSPQDHQVLSDWLRSKYKIRSHMAIYSGYRNLVIDLESRKSFIELVKGNLVPCLQYKAEFREYAQWVN